MMILTVVYVFVAGILNRFRGNGGSWGPDWSHGIKRLIVSWWLALVFVPVLDPAGLGLLVLILLIWIIGYTPGWGAYFDMSDNPPEREVGWIDWVLSKAGLTGVSADLLGMSLRGLHFTVPVALYLAWSHGDSVVLLFAPAGLLMGSVYYGMLLLYNAQSRVRFDRIAWAEYAWGGVLASIYIGMRSAL
ncbi:MAG: hypothetical protein OQL08_08800 [Gammaproteobacteria bacterium]|nr:hypothetical protein [Gammaproteobacteria bacterium]